MTQIPDGKGEQDAKLVLAKRQLEKLMLQFHGFLEDKMLPENKSQGQQRAESDFVLRLLQAANEVDTLNYPNLEGTFGLIILMFREGFVMRDNNNRLEYKHKLLEAQVNKLEKQLSDLSRVANRNPQKETI
jgi:hypothetical protein